LDVGEVQYPFRPSHPGELLLYCFFSRTWGEIRKAVQSRSPVRLFILTWRYGKNIKKYFLYLIVIYADAVGQLSAKVK